jgi:response regulator of citrate/malate metabolism
MLSLGGIMETQNVYRRNELLHVTEDFKGQKSRILIVEDDITCEPIWDFIIGKADNNARYEWVTSVSEAEYKIDESLKIGYEFDLVIADIFLSDSKTGIDLWQKYYAKLNNKMILVSGIEQLKLIKYVGADHAPIYLKKPLNIEDCIEAVYGVLHSKSF